MLDKRKLHKKVLYALLTSPITLGPLVLGVTLMSGALAFSNEPGGLAFSGLALVLAAAGTFFTRFLLGSEKITHRAVAELQAEAVREQEKRLDELDGRLVRDDDPRTEAALRDLRAFDKAFRDQQAWGGPLNAASKFEIVSGVQALFDACVKSLEDAFRLWETAHRLRTQEARRPILARREEIIGDVQRSIEQLSRIMVGIQQLGGEGETDSDLARIRTALDENLAVARKVEERMRSWQRETYEME